VTGFQFVLPSRNIAYHFATPGSHQPTRSKSPLPMLVLENPLPPSVIRSPHYITNHFPYLAHVCPEVNKVYMFCRNAGKNTTTRNSINTRNITTRIFTYAKTSSFVYQQITLHYIILHMDLQPLLGPWPILRFLGPSLWSSGQSSWLQIQRSRIRFPALPNFLRSSGSGTGSTQPREDN
jgi:hypothetical protein